MQDESSLSIRWLTSKGAGKSDAGEPHSGLIDQSLAVNEITNGIGAVIVSHLHSDQFHEAARAALPQDLAVISALHEAAAIFSTPARTFDRSMLRELIETDSRPKARLRISLDGNHEAPASSGSQVCSWRFLRNIP
ncbi:hypothetical protein BH24PSE2_BH24PSE2_23000 [soil metagenome]